MENIENTVAAGELENSAAAEQSADDAQAAVEITAEEVIANLNAGSESADETAENEGDGDLGAQESKQEESGQKSESDKRGRQIAAALKQQRQTIFADLGMSEADVRELIRAHKAEQLSKDNPDVSPKAARMIVEAQEKAASGQVTVTDQQAEDIKTLYADGWTKEELLAFSRDKRAAEDIAGGMSVRQAAHAYLSRRGSTQTQEAQTSRKKAAPIARASASGAAPEPDPIKNMTPAQYDAFMADLRRRAMNGEKVRI